MPRALSQNPATVERRERKFMAEMNKAERVFNREVMAIMCMGMSFDDAWCCAGGSIYTDEELREMREAADRQAMN